MLHGGEIYHGRPVQYDFSVNINPLGIPGEVGQALRDSADVLSRYPDRDCSLLRSELAELTGVPAEQILCGNGASELIEAAVRALRPRRVLLTAPSFSGYLHAAEGVGVEVRYHTLRREENFALTDRYLEDLKNLKETEKPGASEETEKPGASEEAEKLGASEEPEKSGKPEDPGNPREPAGGTDLAILCTPANPVGNLIDQALLKEIAETCERQGTWLMVDECFLGFIEDGESRTMRRQLVHYPHLLVLDAFTKRYAMPGIRLGTLMAADPEILRRIHAQQPEWSVSVPAQAVGCAALSSGAGYMDRARALIRDERKRMVSALRSCGFRVYPGEANFILFTSEIELQEPLLARGILIRNCDNYQGLRQGDYRIAVLRPDQNDVLLRALRDITGRGPAAAEMRSHPLSVQRRAPGAGTPRPDRPGQTGRVVMMACTERGFATMRRAAAVLAARLPEAEILQTGRCASVPGFEEGPGLSVLTKRWFHEADALIFFAATGIAVRCIAPLVEDKFRDPAVLCADENGRYVISLLSGHAGGANRLCTDLAQALGAEPVITTATDGRGLFAVDVFAVENGLQLSDRRIAKQISARLLAGETVSLFCEKELEKLLHPFFPQQSDLLPEKNGSEAGLPPESRRQSDREAVLSPESRGQSDREAGLPLPDREEDRPDTNRCPQSGNQNGRGVFLTGNRRDADIILSWRQCPGDRKEALYLIPKQVTAGIGCRKNIDPDRIRQALQEALRDAGIFREALCGIASIELKKDEPGLHRIAAEWNLPLYFYTAEELNALPGRFSSSSFVRNITGVDCVCERSALQLAGPGGQLLSGKQSLDGVTAAFALRLDLVGAGDGKTRQ